MFGRSVKDNATCAFVGKLEASFHVKSIVETKVLEKMRTL